MKPLNPLCYIRNNIKKALPIFLSVALGVFLVYLFSIFSATTNRMIQVASLDVTKHYNIIYTKDNTELPTSFLKRLEAEKLHVIPVQMNLSGFAYNRGGMGATTITTFNLFEEDTTAFLENFHIKLKEGSLPRNNQNEILLPTEIVLQNYLKVGDYVGSEISYKYNITGKYRVSGLTVGDVLFAVTCQPLNKTREQIVRKGVMYNLENIREGKQRELISDLPENVIVMNKNYYEQGLSATLKSMKLLSLFITAVLTIVLCVALGSINKVILYDRLGELTILHSIGFTKVRLMGKLWAENLLICICAYFTGLLVTTCLIAVFNHLVLVPQGKILELITAQGLSTALLIPLFVSFFSLLPNMPKIGGDGL